MTWIALFDVDTSWDQLQAIVEEEAQRAVEEARRVLDREAPGLSDIKRMHLFERIRRETRAALQGAWERLQRERLDDTTSVH